MSLASMEKELEANQVELAALKPAIDEAFKLKIDEIEKEWTKYVETLGPQMKQFILEQLEASGNLAPSNLFLVLYGVLRR